MRVVSTLGSLMALAATACSRPFSARAAQATDQAFEVTDLVIADVDNGNTTMFFNIHDPDPITNSTAACSASWLHGSTDYPSGVYKLCPNSTFAWRLDSVVSLQNFILSVDHAFKDPSVGDPPYDYITNFGRVALNNSLLNCQSPGNRFNCQQKDDVIYAPIYGTIAK